MNVHASVSVMREYQTYVLFCINSSKCKRLHLTTDAPCQPKTGATPPFSTDSAAKRETREGNPPDPEYKPPDNR